MITVHATRSQTSQRSRPFRLTPPTPAVGLLVLAGLAIVLFTEPVRAQTSGASAANPARKAATGRPWEDMDYGPFLTASIEAPSPRTNIACKGIAIRLNPAATGSETASLLFDTDLLRYAAGWTGGFVALKGVVFDGEHWAYPAIQGTQVFGNPILPGWSQDGRFNDPRPFPYGPLPQAEARWKELYLHGNQVVLSMSVGGTEIEELPSMERSGFLTVFTRSIRIGPSSNDLELQVAFEPGREGRFLSPTSLRPAASTTPAGQTLVLLQSGAGTSRPATAAPPTNGLLAHWDFEKAEGSAARSTAGPHQLTFTHSSWQAGHTGAGVSFTGTGEGMIAPEPSLDFLATDLSVSAWVNPTADGVIFAQTAPAGPWVPDGKALFIRGGRLCFDIGWVGAIESSQPVPFNQWSHVALTWSHSEGLVTLYVNGATDGARALKPKARVANEVLRVGFSAPNFPPSPRFKGTLDDLRIYTRALRQQDVQALGGATTDPAWLIAGVRGGSENLRWIHTPEGHLRLRIPAAATPRDLTLLLARTGEALMKDFATLVNRRTPPPDFAALKKGGPSRWAQPVTTQPKRGDDTQPFAVDSLTWPDDNPWSSWMRFGGFDFFQDATRAAICTWSGDVWIVSGLDGANDRLTWRRFATGLYQPLGLRIVKDVIHVLGRDQITRLRDLNGDGEADYYESFNNDTMNTEHFHEFALDLQTDAAGNFYYMKGARHARPALHPQHGTFMKVSADGSTSEILATGLRAPNGLLITPGGDAYTTDQEGYWMPANRIDFLKRGSFQGNNWSWVPGGKRADFDPPIVWIHPSIDRSPSTLAWVDSKPWSQLQDRLLSFSYGVGRIFLVSTQWVGGTLQGGITPLPLEFETGLMRARFSPRDGQLYVCGLYGWAGNKTQPGGFFRIRRTTAPLQLPTEIRAVADGLVLTFLEPLDPSSAADPGNYSVQSWTYRWTENYGSPDFKRNGDKGRDRLAINAARVARDGKSVFLHIPSIAPTMQMHVQMNLRNASGSALQTYVHHTLHGLDARPGSEWLPEVIETTTTASQDRLRNEQPGLIETLTAKAGGSTDTRKGRLVALHVPSGSAATPFVDTGAFTCRWQGFVKADLSGSVRFSAEGRGTLTLRVNGKRVLETNLEATAGPSEAVALKGGLNALEASYTSPDSGDATVRLYWEGEGLAREPLPPGALVHDASDPALRLGNERRLGRRVFGERQCAQCHEATPKFTAEQSTEWMSGAASLEDAGSKFHPAWMMQWLLSPSAVVPEARMPAMLSGDDDAKRRSAGDLATFLSTLRVPSLAGEPVLTSDPTWIKRGEETFSTLGCVACHRLADIPALPSDPRRTLAHVRAKWLPTPLRQFLMKPEAGHAATRMPNFHLSLDEANGLAALLLSRGAEPAAFTVGDAKHGRDLAGQLGCANCHAITGVSRSTSGPALAQLVARPAAAGCLAVEEKNRGAAPRFGLVDGERQAVSRFMESDLASLRRKSLHETAEEHFQSLRCAACHQREDAEDFWFKLEAADPTKKPPANPYDDDDSVEKTIHRQRPPLTLAGEKLRPEWIEDFVAGRISYKPRPKLPSRMPSFPAYAHAIALGLAEQHGFGAASPARQQPDPALADAGFALARKGALACMDCHAVGTQQALAGADTVTINFAYIPERLNRRYYDRYLQDPPRVLPGTMMPKFVDDHGRTGVTAHFDGDARKQFEALWHFMLRQDAASAPR